jgi:hypothetical protein
MQKFSLNLKSGKPIAFSPHNNRIIYVGDNKKGLKNYCNECDSVDFIPDFKSERECVYLTGVSGCGKSYLCGKYLRYYQLFFPNNKKYLVSNKGYDESLDSVENLFRIPIDSKIKHIKMDSLSNSIIIFDDVDGIRNKSIRKSIYSFIDELLSTGRSYCITVIITSHLTTNYNETRMILNECNKIIIFPRSGNDYAIRRMLNKYLGFPNKNVDMLLDLPSRWVMIYKGYPNYLIYKNGIKFIS